MSNFDDISDPLGQRLADGLERLQAVARQLDWQAADAKRLTPTQADILRFVARRPDGVRLMTAAAHAGIRNATASEVVGALERKGYVKKLPDPEDGRAVLIRITGEGAALAGGWPQSYGTVIESLSKGEQEELLALVVRMIRDLHQKNLIAPQRTCVTCRHFRENQRPADDKPHYCAFVGAYMADRHLRIDCTDHEEKAA
ncbi:transcriptional regulator [Iodidimonas gelatinilytica]|uniref:Transcriptional regulator n=1 Tax=Iodidimonas gelatinilytica TaxID=1236966 RepID=A0A5A7MRE7_9PROT|nr:MarR family winged helix-turn-helix transcriptional regulator [Iodidimonas gelatinilytica]GEQ98521.1 transcriptional regulator [Iodidimonas gelatinilytica]